MTHLTRQVLDAVLPANVHLESRARKIAGIAKDSDRIPLEACLLWLADMTERDRFSGFGKDVPAWRKKPGAAAEWWDIRISGLAYKTSAQYLTQEGWPNGTRCWYVRMECGWREFVAAEGPTLAALRAVVVAHCWQQWRAISPDDRPDLIDVIEEFMTK
jgi:hypothetical protein